ncbi:MAG: hypothetical protein ACE5JG_05780 [Planctomycetota bacterium]
MRMLVGCASVLVFSVVAGAGEAEGGSPGAPATRAPGYTPLSASERSDLRGTAPGRLEGHRGGNARRADRLGGPERAAVRAAQQQTPRLEELRGSELTDRELIIIAITVGVILLLVIIL